MRSAVPVLVILSLLQANRKYRRNSVAYSFLIIIGQILWKQISFQIILSQVVGSDSQYLSLPKLHSEKSIVRCENVQLKVKC